MSWFFNDVNWLFSSTANEKAKIVMKNYQDIPIVIF